MTATLTETSYGLGVTVELSYEEAIERTKQALAEEGFGVLTEIDIRATLKSKIGADVEPYIILGACNPGLAHQALTAEQEIGLLLPCNVVVRAIDEGRAAVSAMDPQAALGLVDNADVASVATEARERLQRALLSLVNA
ncbi:MAG: DUF302 domain-containing protein [Thermomicrobiales bacterium]|nr:DUF302 domain-containing protein [Thermomicrobiales bacterium]